MLGLSRLINCIKQVRLDVLSEHGGHLDCLSERLPIRYFLPLGHCSDLRLSLTAFLSLICS